MERIVGVAVTVVIFLLLLGAAKFLGMLTWISAAVLIFSALGCIGEILFGSDSTSDSPTLTDTQKG